MVSYRKRSSVWQYEISYKDTDGSYKKLRKSGFKRKSDAILAASQLQASHPQLINFKEGQLSIYTYFSAWIKRYKQNSVTNITYLKYKNSAKHIKRLFGTTRLTDLTQDVYQDVLNQFAKTHSKRTVSGFHKQIRACLLDALDDKIIVTDPTRKAIITGREYTPAKKYLNYDEWRKLITNLDTQNVKEMMIYLAAVTGMRYGEIAGLTKSRINFDTNTITVDRTWDYKYSTGFKKTKNTASIRKIPLDSTSIHKLLTYIQQLNISDETPIFMESNKLAVSAQINNLLTEKLKELHLPRITFHGLRHTHASILLYKGVSVLSVSKRLGHSNITTTQSTYLHIIKELEAKDQNQILNILAEAN